MVLGRQVVLGKEIGKGGEGAVYDIPGTAFVAKVAKQAAGPIALSFLRPMRQLLLEYLPHLKNTSSTTRSSGLAGGIIGAILGAMASLVIK